jgi:hypothetical protein
MRNTDMIQVGEVGPGVTMLINDSGAIVLHTAAWSIEVDGEAFIEALTRSKPVANLVRSSTTPISGMSAPVEQALAKFGCTRVSEVKA